MTATESPVIVMPESHRDAVKTALAGEKAAMDPYMPPEAQPYRVYMVAILEGLLENGRVVAWDTARALKKKHGVFSGEAYQRACVVTEKLLAS